MIRLLLSLLALMSGLAVQVVPAQARLCGQCETEIETPAIAQSPALVAALSIAVAAVYREPSALIAGPARHSPAAQIVSGPGVLIGIDRARE